MKSDSIFLPLSLQDYSSSASSEYPEVGSISSEQSAIVGHESWIFLYKGSNSYYNGYIDADHGGIAQQWSELIRCREQNITSKSIQFAQIIVPNKASVMPEHYPIDLPNNLTCILSGIIDQQGASFLCPIEEWKRSPAKEAIFRRNDSHLTTAGNAYLAELIIENFGLPFALDRLVETFSTEHVGDLGIKYDPRVSEILQAPNFSSGLLDQSGITKISEYIPSNSLNGIKQTFVNSDPIYNKSVLIFGNSFFEKCPSWGLTPFFTALFRETLFVWSPEVDYSLIDQVGPDFVIAQTCERFLCKVPRE